MTDVPVLLCTAGTIEGERISVPEGGLSVGRAEENDVVLQADGISRFHARLLYDNGALWLQDAGSRNGVFVNDVRVTGHQGLRVGDCIRIGSHHFEVRWNDKRDDTGAHKKPTATKRWWWPFGG